MKCKCCGQEIKEKTIQEIPAKTLEWGEIAIREMNWQDAKEWCEEQGGRLPTLVELVQAYEDKVPGFGSSYYWSSTELSATYAYDVYFSNGGAATSYKSGDYSVRCVRVV